MKKNLLIPCLCLLYFTQYAVAQRIGPGKPIVQSPYYDAIVLYYAFQNINAFPLPSSDAQVESPHDTNNNNPNKPTQPSPSGLEGNSRFNHPTPASDTAAQPMSTFAGRAVSQTPAADLTYTIFESSSGKILLDNFNGNLDSLMKTFQFEEGEQKTFIQSVLARNTRVTDSSDAGILSAYQQNPYLNGYLSPIYAEVPGLRGLSPRTITSADIYKNYNLNFSKLGGGGPGFASLAINAYTDYIIDAVNAEIDDAFFIHLREALERYPELPLLFPNVMDGLNKIKVTKYKQSISLLKSGYQEDLRNLLSNVSKLATLQKYRDLINKHPWLTLIFITCDLIDYIKKGNIPADILYQINASDYIRCVYANDYSSVLKLAALISYCLRDIKIGDENTNTRGWVEQSKLDLMKNNGAFFEIFTGLMAANADSIHFKNGFDYRTALYVNRPGILKTRYIVYNFTEAVKNINNYISQTLSALKDKSPTTVSAYDKYYVNEGSELLGLSGASLAVLPGNKAEPAAKEISKTHIKIGPLFSQANQVITKIESKEYNAAVYEMDTLLQLLFIGGLDDSTDYRVIKYKKFEDTYIKYGSFIAAIASAQSEEDMTNAIKSFALPTGSSRIKKEHYFSVGLNSYVGFTHSWNKLYPPLNIPPQENWFTVPLGISFNFGLNHFGSISLFGGIIDVGAIFTYKINSDSAVQPTITFAQIFSPSIGIVYGLPIIKKYNIPLSVGANFQWGPTLQKVDQTGNSILPLMTRRFNVFIAVDIPLVNFYVSRQY